MSPIRVIIAQTAAPIINWVRGDKGAKGEAATISVGVVGTGSPGTNATVVNTGTEAAAVFDFTLPRGPDGIPGVKGDKGEKGDTGLPGTTTWPGITDKPTTLAGFGITDAVNAALLAAPSGVATLDGGGKLASSQLPDIAVVDYLGAVSSQAAMLALTGQKGDWVTRTDLGSTWIITGGNPAVIGGWTQLSYPTAPVTSVAGKTGAVTLAKADVGLANVDNTSDVAKPVSTAQAVADTAVGTAAANALTAHAVAGGSVHPAATTATAGFQSAADKTKLDGIATGATANATNAFLLDRTNHTGSQAQGTISGLTAALDARVRFDASQTLTNPQKTQGLANLGVFISGGGAGEADVGKIPFYTTGGALRGSDLIAEKGGEDSVVVMTSAAGHQGVISPSQLTSLRYYNLPDSDGTLALKNTLITPQYGGLGANLSASSGVPLFTSGSVSMTATSGSGSIARTTSPVFTTPSLGSASGTALTLSGNLSCRGISLPGAGVGGLNDTVSFGKSFDAPAIVLYDDGPGARFGWGLRAGEMQFYLPTDNRFSWNSGGDFQISGANELMRLTGNGCLLLATSIDAGERLQVAGSARITGQTELTGQSAAGASSAMTRGLVEARTLPAAVIGECPRFMMFDDFIGQSPVNNQYIGAYHWAVQNGGFAASATTSSDALFLGGVTISALANAAEYFNCQILSGEAMAGSTYHALFAVPNFASTDVMLGFSLYDRRVVLRANSAANSGRWVLDCNGTIYTLGTVTPVAGTLGSGTRYRLALTVNSATSVSIRLDSAPHNAATWTNLINQTVAVSALSFSWNSASCGLSIFSTTAAVRSVEVDYIGVSSTRAR